ncbi:MAG: 4-hydroxybenzoate synthetase [Cycloclasticus sp. symbiont of Bathymodiolus heckerae]|nr:MAG: 4-hydroxybenzoate synthetase [Cycloclasticus sp. symbiont of Bathymodiolus heckerae]
MPSSVSAWMLESNSLTYRIKNSFQQPFNVQLKGQGLAKPFLSDANALNELHHCYAIVREVVLSTGGQPLVFARTTLPRQVAKNLQELTHLGSRPLGEVIFSYPNLSRVRLDFTKVHRSQLNESTKKLIGAEPYVWGRRNTYKINQCEFLVSEFFLPALFES